MSNDAPQHPCQRSKRSSKIFLLKLFKSLHAFGLEVYVWVYVCMYRVIKYVQVECRNQSLFL